MTTLLLSAGDASGDLHAAGFVHAFREKQPRARFVGLGGDEMHKAGVEIFVHQRELAVGGLLELMGSARGIVSVWRRMDALLREVEPDLAVLVDSGGFNLPFARRLRRRCSAPILYYVAPQVWAWRRGRIRKLARRVDRLAVIFPFEPEVYAGTRLRVDFVGHPLVESLSSLARERRPEAVREALGLPAEGPLVALLPGSRRNEVSQQLSVQLEAARKLHDRDPRVVFALALAPTIPIEVAQAWLDRAALPPSIFIRIVQGASREVMLACDLALAKPGTVTVELALLARPMVVMGRANALTAAVIRRAVKLPSLTMPNLIVGKPIVPEFLQEEARPESIADALAKLLEGPAREQQLADLGEVRRRLGAGGAARRVSQIAEEMLGASTA
ncbi:MAG: lipid-A-disaccharide synthase [Deltaproteobacteria bacterium]|nr:lipid-A-disaccharide synthase [Deltaproteobacteria bacterium]MBW2417255.1 lipid-A-disaccharide synthase [Deltaproteobacteria bacterium]